MMLSDLVSLLNVVSASWGEMMVRASLTGGAVIALLWTLCHFWPGMSPSGRSWLWRAAFAKLVLALCWGLSVGIPVLPSRLAQPLLPAASTSSQRQSQERQDGSSLYPSPLTTGSTPQEPDTTPDKVPLKLTVWSVLLLVWCLSIGVLCLRALRAWRLMRRWYDESEPVINPALTASLKQLCQHFDLALSPQLRSCPFIDTLALAGVHHPTILLSPHFLHEHKASLPLMLAHELAHYKRRDLAWNWLLLVGQTLFWFHPLVWLGAREWRMAQEVACDNLAIKATQVPVAAYGAMLLQSAIKGRFSASDNLFAVGVGERYATLHKRLSAMKHFSSISNNKRALLFCGLFAGAALLPWHLAAQSASAHYVGYSAATVMSTVPSSSNLVGKPAPSWSSPPIAWMNTSKPIPWSSLKGQVTVIEFFRVGCTHCKDAAPSRRALYLKYCNKGAHFIAFHSPGTGVSIEGNWKKVQSIVTSWKIPYPVGFDSGGSLFRKYGLSFYPTVLVVDSQGIVRFQQTGYTPAKNQELAQFLDQSLKNLPSHS